uniref:Uncharacterized protein n=1 Tax=Anguilla anguilla TaxID=7936 RepID=A0A0E9T0I2_ANGAN
MQLPLESNGKRRGGGAAITTKSLVKIQGCNMIQILAPFYSVVLVIWLFGLE